MNTDIWLMLMFTSYKVVCLAVGLLFSYMGYKLFMADKDYVAGELDAKSNKYRIVLTKAAPGTFFSFFGTIVIAVTILKGVEYHSNTEPSYSPQIVKDVLPNKPPF